MSYQGEWDRQIGDREARADADVSIIRELEAQWDRYRYVAREQTARFEHAAADGRSATRSARHERHVRRRELDAFAERLSGEQAELLADAARQINSACEEEVDQLRRERSNDHTL